MDIKTIKSLTDTFYGWQKDLGRVTRGEDYQRGKYNMIDDVIYYLETLVKTDKPSKD